jgi:hypothetical protein
MRGAGHGREANDVMCWRGREAGGVVRWHGQEESGGVFVM